MITSLSSSALNLMNTANHKVADAAQTITSLSTAKDELGSTEISSNSILNPLLSLKEAEIESSAAVKILQTEQETLGSLFDAIA
ncbi:MAG: hypothetical protein L3J59_15065 [Methylococcaceae bacterium]|nr:hypothetical protein [Methylococcaceae bacterium]